MTLQLLLMLPGSEGVMDVLWQLQVVYTDPLHGKRYKYQAVGLSAEPADAAFFELLDRKSNQGGRQISVAEYFDKVNRATGVVYPLCG